MIQKGRSILQLFVGTLVVLVLCSCGGASNPTKPKPRNPEKAVATHVQLGMKYLQANRRDHARRQFRTALEINGRSAEAHTGMALVHQANGEQEHAEESFKKALKHKGRRNESQVRYSYGLFQMEQKKYVQACKNFEIASGDIDFNARANALFFVGKCSYQLCNFERAFAAYDHALNLNQKLAPAMLELALMHFDEREYAESKRYLDRFANTSSHTASSLWLGIRIERIFGNQDKEASYGLILKNMHGYSQEYLKYKKMQESGVYESNSRVTMLDCDAITAGTEKQKERSGIKFVKPKVNSNNSNESDDIRNRFRK